MKERERERGMEEGKGGKSTWNGDRDGLESKGGMRRSLDSSAPLPDETPLLSTVTA